MVPSTATTPYPARRRSEPLSGVYDASTVIVR